MEDDNISKSKLLIVLSALLAAILVAGWGGAIATDTADSGAGTSASVSVDAEAPTQVGTATLDEGYTVSLWSDGTAKVTKALTGAMVTSIAETVLYDSDGDGTDESYTVTTIGRGAFSSSASTSITIPKTVTSIESSTSSSSGAFSNSDLETLIFAEGTQIKSIGDYAFSRCQNLKTIGVEGSVVEGRITIPEGVTEIGKGAFQSYYGTSFNGVTLEGAISVKEISLPASLEKIGEGAFPEFYGIDATLASGNKNFRLTDGILYEKGENGSPVTLLRAFNPTGAVTVPSTVVKIAPYAFATYDKKLLDTERKNGTPLWQYLGFEKNPLEYTNVESVTFECTGELEIGDYAFRFFGEYANNEFATINIESEIKTGYRPFTDMKGVIAEVEISEQNSFGIYGNVKIGTLTVTYTRTVGDNVSTGSINTIKAEKVILPANITVWPAISLDTKTVTYAGNENVEEGTINLPASITSIGRNAFQNRADLTSFDFKGIISIGENAFEGTGLTEVTFPSSVASIEKSAFSDSMLTKITFEEGSAPTMGSDVFSDCEHLSEVNLPTGFKVIGSGMFQGCVSLTSITLPEGLEEIGASAFGTGDADKPAGIESISFPSTLTSIGNEAFAECKGLESITFADAEDVAEGHNLTIGSSAFSKTGITSVHIPSYAVFGNRTFDGCSDLAAFTVDEGATGETVQDTFRGCTSLTKAELPASFVAERRVFQNCSSLTEVKIGAAGSNAQGLFENCSSLTKVDIGSGATSLNSTFKGCTSLTTFDVPEAVTKLSSAFSGCTSLVTVNAPGVVEIGNNTFKDCTSLDAVYVDSGLSEVGTSAFAGSSLLTTDGNGFTYATVHLLKESGDPEPARYIMSYTVPAGWDGVLRIASDYRNLTGSIFSGEAVREGVLEKLESIVVEEGNYVLESGLVLTADKSTLVLAALAEGDVKLPSTLKTVSEYAFVLSPGEFTLSFDSESVSIEDYAFRYSGISGFTAPEKLIMGSSVFSNTENIKYLDFSGTTSGDNFYGSGSFSISVSGNKYLEKVLISDDIKVSISINGSEVLRELRVDNASSVTLRNNPMLSELYLGKGLDRNAVGYSYSSKGSIGNNPNLETVYVMSNRDAFHDQAFVGCGSAVLTLVIPLDKASEFEDLEEVQNFDYYIGSDTGTVFLTPYDGAEYDYVSGADGTATISIKVGEGYSDRYSVKIGNTTVSPGEDGNYTFAIPEGSSTLILDGFSKNRYVLALPETDKYTIENISEPLHGETYYFRVIPSPGYEIRDLTLTIGGETVKAFGSGTLYCVLTADAEGVISGVVPCEYNLQFIDDGRYLGSKTYVTGEDLDLSDLKNRSGQTITRWYTEGSETPYDFSQGILSDLVLYSSPMISDVETVIVSFSSARGEISAYVDGTEIASGDAIPANSDVTFVYDGGNSYRINGWYVNGQYDGECSVSKTVSAGTDLTVTVSATYYHSGYQFVIDAPLPIPGDTVEKMLFIGESYGGEGGLDGYYEAMPAGHVIVEDYLYISDENKVIRIDLNGKLDSEIISSSLSIELEAAADELYYVNGYIVEVANKQIMDTDLNPVAKLNNAYTKVIEYDGKFLGMFTNGFALEHLETDDSGETVCVTDWFAAANPENDPDLGKDSDHIAIYNGYAYFLTSNRNGEARGLASIDLETGALTDRMDTTPYVGGHYWDDGWISVYDGYLYFNTYTKGLFGETRPAAVGNPAMVRIAVEDGHFLENSIQIVNTIQGQKSGLASFMGRGYVSVGDTLYVMDMETFDVIYTVTGTFTHGGIVLNTYYANEENDWKVYIYVVPYGATQSICVYEDCQGQTSGKVGYLENMGAPQYATTSVMATASGYLVWYNDSSILFVYGNTEKTVTFVSEGETVSEIKADNGSTIELPSPPAREGYEFAGWATSDGTVISGTVTVGGNAVYTAVWKPVTHTVTFVSEGETVSEIDVTHGSAAAAPYDDPVKAAEGDVTYAFEYWALDGVRYDMSAPVTGDLVLTAVFSSIQAPTPSDDGMEASSDSGYADVKMPESPSGSLNVTLSVGSGAGAASGQIVVKDASSLGGKTLTAGIEAIANEFAAEGDAYRITVTADSADYSGRMEITLPWKPSEGKVPAVYYCVGGISQEMEIVSYDSSSVTFATDHNSVYVVSSVDAPAPEAPPESGTDLAIIAIFTVCGVAAGMFILWMGTLIFRRP